MRCVTQYQAEKFIERFIGILNKEGSDLGDNVQTANTLLASSFQEVSDSINSLAGFPLGSVTAASKEAYIAGISRAPATQGIETISISVANCREIFWHWNFKGVGSGQYPVRTLLW